MFSMEQRGVDPIHAPGAREASNSNIRAHLWHLSLDRHATAALAAGEERGEGKGAEGAEGAGRGGPMGHARLPSRCDQDTLASPRRATPIL